MDDNLQGLACGGGPSEMEVLDAKEGLGTLSVDLRSRLQTIPCKGNDSEVTYSIEASNVVIEASDFTLTDSGSNKVKVSQISKFEWEQKLYTGNLVSSNMNYIAYQIRAKGGSDDHVRVINYHTSSRVLLKCFHGNIVDLSFASVSSSYLACIDSAASVFVFKLYDEGDAIRYSTLLDLNWLGERISGDYHLAWAPHIPLSDVTDKILVVSYGVQARVYNINEIAKAHGDDLHTTDSLQHGVIKLDNCHSKPITGLVLSPDLQVLATSSYDGEVKFWSLNFAAEDSPRCLHEWEPHEGMPVTAIHFCDNLLSSDESVPFWRFIITATEQNSVLKIWCAVSWNCLQTIRFEKCGNPLTTKVNASPCMKAAMDRSASYFLLSDVNRQVLYVLHLIQDVPSGRAYFSSVSEYILTQPLLSFSILSTKLCKERLSCEAELTSAVNGFDAYEANEDELVDKDCLIPSQVLITLFGIHSRSLQKLSIRFKPESEANLSSGSTAASSQEDALSLRDTLSDMDPGEQAGKAFGETSLDRCVSRSVACSTSSSSSFTAVSALISPLGSPSQISHGNPQADLLLNQETERSRVIQDKIIGEFGVSLDTVPACEAEVLMANDVMSDRDTSHDALHLRRPMLGVHLDKSSKCNQDGFNSVADLSATDQDFSISSRPDQDTLVDQTAEARLDMKSELLPENGKLTLLHAQQAELLQLVMRQQEMLQLQDRDIRELKDVVQTLVQDWRQQRLEINADHVLVERERQMQIYQKSASSQFLKSSNDFQKSCTQRLEQFTSEFTNYVTQKEEQTVQSITQAVLNGVGIKMDKVVKMEVRQSVLPALEKVVVKQLDAINSLVAQKLSVWERTLREESQELLRSKPVAESIGYAAASVLEGTIPDAYRKAFQNTLLPSFERAANSMFSQINQSFQQGTKQYLEKLESHLEAKRQKQQESREPLLRHLQDLIDSFQATADVLTNNVETNLVALVRKELHDHADSVIRAIQESADSSIEKIKETVKALKVDVKEKVDVDEADFDSKKERIMKCVESGDFPRAFEIALTASNLALVMFLCQQVEPQQLFDSSSDAPLPQPIILSLIQQLSVDLGTDTDIKIRYLEESIMALDSKDDITREHMPAVLNSLCEQLSSTIEALLHDDSTNKQIKPLKMLLMAAKSLLRHD